MEDKKAAATTRKYEAWPPHIIIALATAIVLIVMLAVQPWSDSSMTRVHSFRMTVSSSTYEPNGYSESAQQIVYAAPRGFHISTEIDGQKQEIIIIGGDIYTSEQQAIGYITMQAVAQGVARLTPGEEHTERTLADLDDRVELENAEIDGVVCSHYRGRLDLTRDIKEQISSLDPEQPGYEVILESLEAQIEMMEEIKTDIQIWVGLDDGLVRRMSYEAEIPSESGGRPYTSSTLLRYYDVNATVIIEAPLDRSGELLPGWYFASISPPVLD
jgi:hypothetical protein